MSRLQKLPPELLLAVTNQDCLKLKDVSALSRCASFFHYSLNRVLYKRDARSPTRWALLWACATGKLSTARMSIAEGSRINEVVDYRLVQWHTGVRHGRMFSPCQTPINAAAPHEQKEIIDLLLGHDVKLNTLSGYEFAISGHIDNLFGGYLPLLQKENGRQMMTALKRQSTTTTDMLCCLFALPAG